MSRSALRNRATTLETRSEEVHAEADDIPAQRAPWWRRRPLVLHTGTLLALVLALSPLTLSTGVGWIDDEGAYALQVEALLDGDWDYGYWAADFDPEGRWQPITRAVVDGEHAYPYVKHPVYVVALAGGAWLFGTGFGLYAVPMLGLVLAAMASWLLAEEFEPRAGPIAFWLVAGSPLLIDAYVLYAHTLGAAVAGAALLVAVRILRHGLTRRRLVAFAAMLSLGGLLRSEALLFGVALVVAVVGALAWRARSERIAWERALGRRRKGGKRQPVPDAPDTRAARTAAWIGGVGVLALGAAIAVERLLVGWIVGGSGAAASLGNPDPLRERTISQFLQAKVEAAWRITFSGSSGFPSASRLVIAAVLVVALVALFGRILGHRSGAWVITIGAAGLIGVLYLVRTVSYPNIPVPGFFGAWPVALAGLVWIPWLRLSQREIMSVAAILMFATTVYATQYQVGGAVEWGGRFLALAVPGVAAVVAAGLLRRWTGRRVQRRGTRGVWAAVALVTVTLVAPATAGIAILHRHRDMNRPFHDDVASVATRVVVIDSGTPIHHGFPKLSWVLNRDHDFLLTLPGDPAVKLLETLYEEGLGAVTVIHVAVDPIHEHTPFPRVEDVTPPHTRSLGGAIHILRRGEGDEG